MFDEADSGGLHYDAVILPQKDTYGWSGQDDDDAPAHPTVWLADALAEQYDTDSMFQAISVPGHDGDAMPRLRKEAMAKLAADGSEPVLTWAVLDLDLPGHQPWASPEAAVEALHRVRVALTERSGAAPYIYTTRAGVRALWRLAVPLPVSVARSYMRQFVFAVAGPVQPGLGSDKKGRRVLAGLELDETCTEWWRVFRVPFATRDGQRLEPTVVPSTDLLDWLPPELVEEPLSGPRPKGDMDLGDEPEPRELTAEEWLHIPERWRAVLRSGQPVFEAHGDPGHDVGTNCKLIPSLCASMARVEVPSAELIYQAVRASVEAQTWPPLSRVWERICDLLPGDVEQWADERKTLAPLMAAAYASKKASVVDMQREAIAPHVDLNETLKKVREAQAEGHPPLVYAGDKSSAYVWYPDEQRYRAKSLAVVPALLESIHGLEGVRTKRGVFKGWGEIFSMCGCDAHEARLRYWSPERGERYDNETKTLYLTTPMPDVPPEAKYDPEVARWLDSLPADASMKERLLDWVQASVDPLRPIAALVLCGPPGIGKSLMATGIGAGWGHVGDYKRTVGQTFNPSIGLSPVLTADDGLAVENGANVEAFKSLITSRHHTLSMKFMNNVQVDGCVRVIINANDLAEVQISADLNQESMAAIEERILFIECSPVAGIYLSTLGDLRSWVEPEGGGRGPGRLFNHALWLSQNRELSRPPGRLVVSGDTNGRWRSVRLANATGLDGGTLVALARWAAAGRPVVGVGVHPDYADTVVVNPSALLDAWEEITKDRQPPRLRSLARALATLSRWQEPKRLTLGSKRAEYHGIPVDLIVRTAKACGVGDEDRIREWLGQSTTRTVGVGNRASAP